MTHEEALTLKEGNWLSIKQGASWTRAIFLGYRPSLRSAKKVCVRKPGFDTLGRKKCGLWRRLKDVQKTDSLDPVSANVFADWLEEQGESKAARMLREAFPFCDGKAKSPPPGT